MCLGFSYYAYENVIPEPASLLLYTDIRSYVQNEGYPNQSDTLGFFRQFLCAPTTCYGDPLCPV